mmetsp:Transcript_26066/g.36532  ORF Transcript_26066/g.36532 Transcript_26066/m.36532 type:complete len:92 (+) Transcript_26066:840-1115(+)
MESFKEEATLFFWMDNRLHLEGNLHLRKLFWLVRLVLRVLRPHPPLQRILKVSMVSSMSSILDSGVGNYAHATMAGVMDLLIVGKVCNRFE